MQTLKTHYRISDSFILGDKERVTLSFPVLQCFHVFRSNTYTFIGKCNISGIYIFLVVHNVEQWDNTLYVAFYRLTLLKAHTSILSY